MRPLYLLAAVMALAPQPARAAALKTLKLADCESAALKASYQLKSAKADYEAAASAAKSADSAVNPQLALEGSLRYIGVIPQMTLPNVGPKALGDNWNYSFGPAAYWTAFDNGATRSARESLRATARAKAEDAANIARQATLSARGAYFQVQLALEELYLLGGQLKLAMDQHADIALAAKAGTVTRLDELQAHQEVLARKRELRQARTNLAAALRELAAITGEDCDYDPSLALDSRMNAGDYSGAIEPPTALVQADPSQELLARMNKYALGEPDLQSPSLRSLEFAAKAAREAAQSAKAGLWPRVQLSAKYSLDYPNGPSLYNFGQSAAGISVSVPLFESGKSTLKAGEQSKKADSADERRLDLTRSIRRDFAKAGDILTGLRAQQVINTEAEAEANELARLSYISYRAGRLTYLEVQAANLRVLAAKTRLAQTDAQTLMQLALMAALGAQTEAQ